MLNSKSYFQISAVIFLIVGVMHLARIFFGWTIVIAGWETPIWASVVGALGAVFLAYSAFKLKK